MEFTGRCYCGEIRYRGKGAPLFRLQCHCRECQYISGGGPNYVMGLPSEGFEYLSGEPRRFRRSDLPAPVTREFCPTCGTHLLTTSPRVAGAVLLKAGTLDDPAAYGGPELAIFACDRPAFHVTPAGIPSYERRPDSYR